MAFVGAWRRSAIVRVAAECCCCAGGRWQLGLPGCLRLSVHGGVLWLSGWLRSVAIVLMGVGSLDFLAVGVCRCMVTAWPADRYDRIDFKRNSTENLFL